MPNPQPGGPEYFFLSDPSPADQSGMVESARSTGLPPTQLWGSQGHASFSSTSRQGIRGSHPRVSKTFHVLVKQDQNVEKWYINGRKLFFVNCDQKLLCDLWRTWIINHYLPFYHSILCDFEMQVLRNYGYSRLSRVTLLRYVICNTQPFTILLSSKYCF